MNLTDPEKLTLYLGAFRYYLGRSTHAVSDFTELLAKVWGELDSRTQQIIREELRAAIHIDAEQRKDPSQDGWCRLGHECDRDSWQILYNTINK